MNTKEDTIEKYTFVYMQEKKTVKVKCVYYKEKKTVKVKCVYYKVCGLKI